MRMDAFEAFSPIPVMTKESTVTELKHMPSAAPGDTSNTPVLHYYDDSISKVSMGDISTWFANGNLIMYILFNVFRPELKLITHCLTLSDLK